MLQNTFYTVKDFSQTQDTLHARIQFNAEHPVFEGHFPKQPIVPGVCMVQIVRELAEQKVQQPLRIHEGDHIKFLKFVNPTERPEVEITIALRQQTSGYGVQATMFDGEDVLFKFTGSFQSLV
jgi:3-hydroxyacyl-[acyl-carrier-protein] dehydratase